MLNSALLPAWACRWCAFYGCFRFNAFYCIHVFTLSCDIIIAITLWYVVLRKALRDFLLLKMNVSCMVKSSPLTGLEWPGGFQEVEGS